MSRKTSRESAAAGSHLVEQVRSVIDRVIDPGSLPCPRAHGNAEWTPALLAATALVWAWQSLGTLTSRFDEARTVTTKLFPDAAVPATYQSFVKALAIDSTALLEAIVGTLRARMTEQAATHWKVGRWCVVAFDGTRLRVPRTADNQTHFDQPVSEASKKKAASKTGPNKADRSVPQAWLTVCWHLGTGLPWAFRHGPGGSSETHHARNMLAELPAGSLVTADAGFVGYDLLTDIIGSGHELLVRVGGNVRLLKSSGYVKRRQGHGGAELVLLWPDKAVRKQQPPVVLRVIRVQAAGTKGGRQPMVLVTSVLMETKLSDPQACAIYRRRWGIEVFMRDFKVTFERGELLSHAPANAERELAWSFVALWSVQLLGAEGLIEQGLSPRELSTAVAVRELQRALIRLSYEPCDLLASLAVSRVDGYERADKSSRDYPRKKTDPPPGLPQFHDLKDHHRDALRGLSL